MSCVIVAIYEVRAGESEAFQAALEAMVEPTSAEPGCLAYRPHRSLDDPNVFFLYEEYLNEDALTAHVSSAHFDRYVNGEARPRIQQRTLVRGEPVV